VKLVLLAISESSLHLRDSLFAALARLYRIVQCAGPRYPDRAGLGGSQTHVPADVSVAPTRSRNSADRLPRQLGVWSAAAVVVGSMIGSGIFRVPSTAAADTGTAALMMLTWVVGGAVALCGALALAEVAALFPRAGGLYVYLHEAYGPLVAFLLGWLILIISPASTAAVALAFGEYLGRLVSLTPLQVRVVAVAAILVLAAANYRSVRYGAAIQNLLTSTKVLAIAALTVAAFVVPATAPGAWDGPTTLPPGTWGSFGLGLVAVLFAYNGWQDATYIAGEIRDPGRSLPRALIGGAVSVTAIYLAANAAYLHVLPMATIAASPLVAADVAVRVVGQLGAAFVTALVCTSTFGTVNVAMMVYPRVFFAMAEDRLFFRAMAAVHPRYATPYAAIVLTAALGIAYVTLRSFEQLIEIFILGSLPFWALAVGAVFVLRRRRPDLLRPYRTPGYPVLPILFVLAMLALVWNSLREHPRSAGLTLAAILAGVPVYYGWARARRRPEAAPSKERTH
jgi:basic amino acid/polyamine antiporter, APA family